MGYETNIGSVLNEFCARTFGKNIIKAKLFLKNPKIVDANGKTYSDFKFKLNNLLTQTPKKYDALIVKNYGDAGKYGKEYIFSDHYIVFDSSAISIIE